MDIEQVREFVRTNHRAVLATQRRDGGVQMSPVLAVLDEDGTIAISTRQTAMKTKNVRRHPYAWIVVMNDRFWGPWVQAEGPVTIVSLPEAMEGLVRYYRLASGEHSNWDEYREAMERDRRVLLKISIERVGPSREG